MEFNTNFEKMSFDNVSIKEVSRVGSKVIMLSVVCSSANSTQVQMEAT
ncbi:MULTISPECIES: hypothetical protein [Vibrio]|nr:MULTISPECIES: hypothetical protein [Vibrio]